MVVKELKHYYLSPLFKFWIIMDNIQKNKLHFLKSQLIPESEYENKIFRFCVSAKITKETFLQNQGKL